MSRDPFAGRPRLRRAAYRALFAVVPLLPMLPTRFLVYLAAHLAWLCDARARRIVAGNLAPLMPGCRGESLRRTVRRNMVLFGWTLIEHCTLHRIDARAGRPPNLSIHDPWRILADPPLAGPAILVCPHANFARAPALLHRMGILERLYAISLSHGDPAIDALFDRVRAAAGIDSLLVDRAPLASLRHLHDGHLVGIVGDRDYSGSGIRVAACGRHIRIPIGPAALAVQTGARILPTFLARRGTARFHLFCGRPIHPRPGVRKADQVRTITRELASWYIRCLRHAPSQWICFHPVWESTGGGKGLGATPPIV